MSKTLKTQIQHRIDTAARWTSNNPKLLKGEIGIESDTSRVKVGDGSTLWRRLPYIDDRSQAEIFSRGEQLVVNGNAFLGDDTNFSRWEYTGAEANGSPGSFTITTSQYIVPTTDEFFSINPNATYEVAFDMKRADVSMNIYGFLDFFDIDKKSITASCHMYVPKTTTQLSADLKPGDTVVHLKDMTNWNEKYTETYRRGFIVWNYVNSLGYQYPPESYSRNLYGDLYTDSSKVNKAAGTITLTVPWKGPLIPKDTYLSQGDNGNTYKYCIPFSQVPSEWHTYRGYYQGTDYSGRNVATKLSPGTAFCKVGILWNISPSGKETTGWLTNVSVREIRDRALSADEAKKTEHALTINNVAYNGAANVAVKTTDTNISSMSSTGTLPSLSDSYDEAKKVLTFTFNAGTKPSSTSVKVVKDLTVTASKELEPEPFNNEEEIIVPEEMVEW